MNRLVTEGKRAVTWVAYHLFNVINQVHICFKILVFCGFWQQLQWSKEKSVALQFGTAFARNHLATIVMLWCHFRANSSQTTNYEALTVLLQNDSNSVKNHICIAAQSGHVWCRCVNINWRCTKSVKLYIRMTCSIINNGDWTHLVREQQTYIQLTAHWNIIKLTNWAQQNLEILMSNHNKLWVVYKNLTSNVNLTFSTGPTI